MHVYSCLYRLATGVTTSDYLSEFRANGRKAMEYLSEYTQNERYASPLMLLDMHRSGLRSIEIEGGVSFSQDQFRPLPIDAQFQLKKAFVEKVYRFGTLRSKAVALASVPFWITLTIFNSTVQPRYHTFLPRRFVR